MITVSIVNVTSYTGVELLRLLAGHSDFQVTSATGRSAVGQQLQDVFPQLHALSLTGNDTSPGVDPTLVISAEPAQTDLAFVCLPHAAAAEAIVALLERGTRVVDLSADFRLHDASVYAEWYKHTHPAPALLDSAVYGLCERYREQIQGAPLVANPGCYATAAILALLPVFTSGIIEPDVIIDAKSGVSGAGRGLTLGTHYAEANEDVSAYSLTGHRHLPEITQELIAGAKSGGHSFAEVPGITFVPHLMPMTRGILATCYANLKQATPTLRGIRLLYEEYYAGEPFVHVVDQPPHTKWTYGSNHCFIYPTLDERTGRLIVISCLDNLVKGASGQAIQNANLQWNLPETTGLTALAVYP
ncbi:MAG TPA: N-acetyl-gamma-glutamyl-phosphate reductase [Ktedonobacteraceae bacterium]|nr:N-acetyl-gamma-glutamyl-phosphate reductase [Ktedonobacteraceae bacterium]